MPEGISAGAAGRKVVVPAGVPFDGDSAGSSVSNHELDAQQDNANKTNDLRSDNPMLIRPGKIYLGHALRIASAK